MAEGQDPLRRLIDVAFFAPIGLVTLAQKELPQLIASGRTRFDNQITLARFIGKMAMRQGKKELERRLDDGERSRQRDVITSPLDVAEAPVAPAESLPEAIIEAVAESPLIDEPATAEPPLPIEGYDSLAASQVVVRLDSLTPEELLAVRDYEAANRNRRTILGKISQLQAR